MAQETGGDTGATDDQKVVFTWGGTAEPASLNPMSGYSAIDAYFWTPQYDLLIDFDVNFDAEPGLATEVETVCSSPTRERRGQLRLSSPFIYDVVRPSIETLVPASKHLSKSPILSAKPSIG